MTQTNGQLKSIIERIQSLEERKKETGDEIKLVYSEAKTSGFDPKIIRKVVSLLKKPEAERTEEEMLIDTYMREAGV